MQSDALEGIRQAVREDEETKSTSGKGPTSN